MVSGLAAWAAYAAVNWSPSPGQSDKLGSVIERTGSRMTGKRQRCSAEFKAKAALEAIRGELTVAQLVAKHGVQQTLINAWKKQAVEGMAGVFPGKAQATESAREGEMEKLHAMIGQLVVVCARPPVDGGRAEAGYGRTGAFAALRRAAVRVAVDQRFRLLPPQGGRAEDLAL